MINTMSRVEMQFPFEFLVLLQLFLQIFSKSRYLNIQQWLAQLLSKLVSTLIYFSFCLLI